jgi:hypothetical protein
VIIGLGAATQLSYYYVMGELVPMKYRLAGNAFCYLFTVPGSGIAPAVANSFILYHPSVGWRGCYYILIGVNTLALLCWVFFYHPPTFHMKHGDDSKLKYVKDFDYTGTLLYAGGLVSSKLRVSFPRTFKCTYETQLILLMGLNWGGSVWPWASAHVIATIVVGFVALCVFVLWESFGKLKEPLVPMHLFRNRGWNAATIVSGLGASIYYAFAIVWPQMVVILYSDDGKPMDGPWLSSLVGLCIVLGEIVGGFCAKSIGKLKYQCFVTLLLGGIFFACKLIDNIHVAVSTTSTDICPGVATCTPNTRARAAALVSFGVFFIGWTESLAITMVTLTAKDQTQLGSASGVAGSIRFLISSISATVYTVILTNRLAQTIPAFVIPAVVNAGLPASSAGDFIAAFSNSSLFADIPNITPTIIAVGTVAYKEANASAYRTVFLVSTSIA